MKKVIIYTIILSLLCYNPSYSSEKYINKNLLNAVKSNNISKIQKYFKKNQVNLKDRRGNTLLSYSIANNNDIITKFLLDNGADPRIIDSTGNFIYCSAKNSKNVKLKKLFNKYKSKSCNKKVAKNSSKQNIQQDLSIKNITDNSIPIFKIAGITAGIVGVGAGIYYFANHNKDKNDDYNDNNNYNNYPDRDYSYVGQVDTTKLNNILNSNGFKYKIDNKTNSDDYNLIRLEYSLARGFDGQINSSSYLSKSLGYPYYYNYILNQLNGNVINNNISSSNILTNSYNIGDKIRVAVFDQGVFSTHYGLKNNIVTDFGNNETNLLYSLYKDMCTENNASCKFDNNLYMHCDTINDTSISCGFYTSDTQFDDTTKVTNTFIVTSRDTTPLSNTSNHGTMVSSIIVGNNYTYNNGITEVNAGATGIAPNAEVLPYLISVSYNFEYNSTLYRNQIFAGNYYIGRAFLDAGANGAVAINNSWGSAIYWNYLQEGSNYYFYERNGSIYYTNGSTYSTKLTEFELKQIFSTDFINNMKQTVSNYDSIFVFSAGNEGQDGPNLQSLLPLYITGDDGKLFFYDSSTGYYKNFIVSVAYNTDSDSIAGYSNKCGVAKYYCLTAPGTKLIVDTGSTVDITTDSGTSFSAPVITGAIAVLKGAFPYLTGAEITKLLFLTARDIGDEGVDDVYGWGMLDLERATRPYGSILVPISTNITSSKQSLSSSTIKLNSTIANSIKSQNLSFIILDDFNRAFTLNLNDYLQSEKTRTNTIDILKNFSNQNITSLNLTKDKKFTLYYNTQMMDEFLTQEFELNYNIDSIDNNNYGFSLYYGNNPYNAFIDNKIDFYNNYSLSNAYGYNVLNPYFKSNSNNNFSLNNIIKLNDKMNFNIGILYQNYTMNYDKIYNNKTKDNNLGTAFAIVSGFNYNINKNIGLRLENSILNETETFLGTKWSGAFGIGDNNLTYITSIQNDINMFNNKLSLFGKANFAYTKVNNTVNSLIRDIDGIYSNSFAIGLNYNFDSVHKNTSSNVSLLFTQPVKIQSGNFKIDLPYARDYSGNIYYKTHKLKFDDDNELNVQLTYNKIFTNDSIFNFGFMYRDYIDNEYIFLLNYKKLFSF